MKPSRPSPLVRVLSRLRRWLRHAWLTRVCLADARRLWGWPGRSPWDASGPPRFRPGLEALEGRFSPDDLFGLGLSALQMPLLTPAAVFLNGWAAGGPPAGRHAVRGGDTDPFQSGAGPWAPPARARTNHYSAPPPAASAAAPLSVVASPPETDGPSPFDPDWLRAAAATLAAPPAAPAGAAGGAAGTAAGATAASVAPAASAPTNASAPTSAPSPSLAPNAATAAAPQTAAAAPASQVKAASSPPPGTPPPGGSGSFNAVEGAPFQTTFPGLYVLNYSNYHYAGTVTWGDGQTSPVGFTGYGMYSNSALVTGAHLYAEEGTDTVTVAVTQNGAPYQSGTYTANVADAPISVALTPPPGLAEGQSVPAGTTVAQIKDADSNSDAGDLSAVVTWNGNPVAATVGDGGAVQTTAPFTFAEEGPQGLTVQATDAGGSTAGASANFTAADAALTLTATQSPPTATVGVALTNVTLATLTDLDPNGALSDYTTTVDWGDGTGTSGGGVGGAGQPFTVSGGHTYAKPGAFTVVVTAVDHNAQSTATLTVNAYAPNTLIDTGGGGSSGSGGGTPTPYGLLPDLNPVFEPNGPSDSPALTGPGPFLTTLGEASVDPYTGGVRLGQQLDFDQSPGTGVSAHPALVYNSDAVSVRPVVGAEFDSDPNAALPASLTAVLTWDGTPATFTYSTAGGHAGDAFELPLQAPAGKTTATGAYPYQVDLYTGASHLTVTGTYLSVVNDASPYGAGWWLDGLDRLVPVTGGVLWAYGDGGVRFFAGAGPTYASPADDFGALVKNTDGTYAYTAKDREQRLFDANGRLTSVVDPHGLTLGYRYDGAGRLTGVAAPDGGLTTLTYTGADLTGVQEPGGRSLTLADDASGNLTQITDVDGTTRALQYDSGHRLTDDQWGPLNATFSYDATTDRLASVNRGGGTVYSLRPQQTQGLDAGAASTRPNRAAGLTDPRGYGTNDVLDANGRLTARHNADGGVETWGLDAAGQASSYTDPTPNHYVTRYKYDAAHLYDLTEVDYPGGGQATYSYDSTYHKPAGSTDDLGEVTTNLYDPATGDLTSATDAAGATTAYAYYQSGGHSTGQVSKVTDPDTHATTYAYDADRRLTTAADALNETTTYAYDASGNPLTTRDPLGNVTTTQYDARGRLTLSAAGDGGQTSYAYDAYGDTVGVTDPNHNSTTYAFDQRGWQTAVTDALHEITTTTYDAAGDATAVTDALNHTTTYAFDPVGREINALAPVSATKTLLTTYAYDLAGNETTVTDPLDETTTYAYDARDRQTAVIDALGHPATTLYDTQGDVTASVDRDAHPAYYAYDKDHRLTATTDALGDVTTTLYDPAGNVTLSVDPDGHRTSYAYDAANRRTLTTDGVGQNTTTRYDAAGNVTEVTDPLGHSTAFGYDDANRRTAVVDLPVQI